MTLIMMTERIMAILNGGTVPISPRVTDAEVKHAVIAACSKALRVTSLDVNYNFDGGSMPSGAMIATYDYLPVEQRGANSARIMLPAQPMEMPERAGVYAVYPADREEDAFMYIPPGTIGHWKQIRLVSDINEILFTAEAKWITVYYDLIGAGIDRIGMKLCVVDINLLGEWEPLPISADQETAVMGEVLTIYGRQPEGQKAGKEAAAES